MSEMQMQVNNPDSAGGGATPASLMGEFMEGAHPTSGTATVNAARTKLTLDNFHSESGPILDFYLATDKGASDYIDLGELQGYDGDYQYVLPSNVNYETYKYLIVWCVEYNINFGYAILE